MKEPTIWRSAALKRQIAEGTIPENVEALEAKIVDEAVQRILGTKPASTPEAEAEPGIELTKTEQRRADAKRAERDRRFGRG